MATHQKKHTKRTGHTKELQLKQEGEEYGEIMNEKGDLRFEVKLIINNSLTIAKARRAIAFGPNKTRITKGDTVLLQLDDSTSSKDRYYIIHKYTQDETKQLKKMGELVTIVKQEETINNNVAFEEDATTLANNTLLVDDDFIADI
jgi:initiation factor 1A